jgi:hypothetical protein
MSLLKDFDLAIAKTENIPNGFVTEEGTTYDSYMSNDAWDDFLAAMSADHRKQFGDGSGGELLGKNGRPPKMASFASSSRMTYLRSKDIPGFIFEKHLPTVIGGIANLDGYRKWNGKSVFVEAKCREPYSHMSPTLVKENYESLYSYLQTNLSGMFSYMAEHTEEKRNMRVKFFCHGEEVIHFDVKQMLCHLLGIANALLKNKACDETVLFLYLLYNPTQLRLPTGSREEILKVYHNTCKIAQSYDFERLFGYVIDFLLIEKSYHVTTAEVQKIKSNFKFALCDQHSYNNYF